MDIYRSLSVKYIQLDTLSYLIFDNAINSCACTTLRDECNKILTFHKNQDRQIDDAMQTAYLHNNAMQVFEFTKFRNKMKKSNRRLRSAIETTYNVLLNKDPETPISSSIAAMNKIFEEKRKNPKEDIISDLVNFKFEDGSQLITEELLSMVSALNIGGNETTTNSIAGGMLILMQQKEKLNDLITGKAKLKNFVEEIIRLETPVQSLFRRVRKDVTIGDVTIPEGSIMDMRFGSANRDEDMFSCPMHMDLERKNPGKHLAYGTSHHHCIGAPLARQEMRMAFDILLKRLKNINLAENKNDFLHHPHFALRGLKELNLTFEKR